METEDTLGQAAGQVSQEQPAGGTQTGQVASAPFHVWKDQSFKTPDELNAFIEKGTMLHSDYTKKRQADAEERKRFENDRSTHQRQVSEFEEKRKGYAKYEEFEKRLMREPHLMREWQKYLNQSPSGNDMATMVEKIIEEKIGPKFKDYEDWRKSQEAESEKKRHFGIMKERFQDFDETAVEDMNDYLMRPESDMGTLMEILYYAAKGKGIDPAKIEKKVLDNLGKKQAAGIPSVKGSTLPGSPKKKPESIDDIRERLMAGAGGL